MVFVFALVKTVSECCSCWLVDDTQYFQAGNLACVLGCLTLSVAEVGRYGDYGLRYLFAEVSFRIGLQFAKNDCGNLLRTVLLAVDVNGVVGAHFTLDAKHRAIRIDNCLTLCYLSDKTLAVFGECYYRRGSSVTFRVGDYDGFAAFQYCNATVCCTDDGGRPGSVTVKIGTSDKAIEGCSVVTTRVNLGENVSGSIGVIGPVRMDYKKVLGVLEKISLVMIELIGDKNK